MHKAREFQKNIYYFIDYGRMFDCMDHYKLWKTLKELHVQHYVNLSPEKPVCGSKSKLELDVEQITSSKLGKKYDKAVYCHPAYSNSIQNTPWYQDCQEEY